MSKSTDRMRAIWCRIAGHSGRETIYTVPTTHNGVTTTRLVSRTCLSCGRRVG